VRCVEEVIVVVFSPGAEWRRMCSGICLNRSGAAGKMVRMNM